MFTLAATFYFYEYLLRVLPAALFSELMRDYSIHATNLGVLSSLYFLPYALLQLPVGVWMDHWGPRRLLTLACFLCGGATLLFSCTTSFALACVARVFIGAGSAFAFISCMKVVTLWFPPQAFSMLAGFTLTIGALGAASGEAPVAWALQYVSWRDFMMWLGWAGLFLGALVWLVVRDENTAVKHIENAGTQDVSVGVMTCLKAILRQPMNWFIAIYAFLTTAPTDAFGGMWGVPYLVHAHGFTELQATDAVHMTWYGLAMGSPFIGWLSARVQSRRLAMWVHALVATITLFWVIYTPSLTLGVARFAFFLFGFSGVFVLSFVAARDINPPQYVGTMVGFVNMASMIGSTLLMSGVGILLDVVHTTSADASTPYIASDYHLSLLPIPLCYALCVLVIIPLIRETFPAARRTL